MTVSSKADIRGILASLVPSRRTARIRHQANLLIRAEIWPPNCEHLRPALRSAR